jgi:rhodanese-related sulfurtransferase
MLHRLFILLFALLSLPAAAQQLSAPEAYEAARTGKLTIIDIRTPPEWKQTRVAQGAKLIDMLHPQGPTGFVNEVLRQVGGDKNAPIALICRTGNRTSQVLRYLRAQGFNNAVHIPEGMAGSGFGPGWLARGLPTEPCKVC